jgi:O-antigen/teichoic acid export membrane protein
MIDKLYNKHKETIQNFARRVLQTFGKQGVVFLIFFLCAKLLTPYDFGIYNYLLAIIFFLIIFSDFGISQSTSKYVAEYNVLDKEKLKNILFNALIVILGLGSMVSLIFLIVAYFWFSEYFVYLIYLLPLIFLAPLTSLYDGIYR